MVSKSNAGIITKWNSFWKDAELLYSGSAHLEIMTSSLRHNDVILSLTKQDVPERMKNFNPSMKLGFSLNFLLIFDIFDHWWHLLKLIMVVCDPVKRVLSRYYHMYEDNDEIKLETFEEQVRFSLNRIQEQDHWDHLLDRFGLVGLFNQLIRFKLPTGNTSTKLEHLMHDFENKRNLFRHKNQQKYCEHNTSINYFNYKWRNYVNSDLIVTICSWMDCTVCF